MSGPKPTGTFGLARVISKRGWCSRSQAVQWIKSGLVRCEGRLVHDPEARTALDANIQIAERSQAQVTKRYLMLNKPRGLVVTASDERARATVYSCFTEANLPWLAPVGRLDQASEGLLLFSNDSKWAADLLNPATHLSKRYHVQIDTRLAPEALSSLRQGIEDQGENLRAERIAELRIGSKNSWLEFELTMGKNRQIRRMLAAFGAQTLRLIRIGIGELALGELGKGAWRDLHPQEVEKLRHPRH